MTITPVPFAAATEMRLSELGVACAACAGGIGIAVPASGYVPPGLGDTWRPTVSAGDLPAAAVAALAAVRTLVVGVQVPPEGSLTTVILPAWVASLCVARPRMAVAVVCSGACVLDERDKDPCGAVVRATEDASVELVRSAPMAWRVVPRISAPVWSGVRGKPCAGASAHAF